MIRQCPSLRAAEGGGPAVDAALIMSALLILILGIIDIGSAYWGWNTMLLAVEEAGRYAMLYNPTAYPNGPPSQTCSASTVTLTDCAVAWANQNGGNVFGSVSCTNTASTMTCTATYNFNFLYPITLTRAMTFPLI